MYEHFDELAQQLARRVGMFTAFSTVTFTAGTSTKAAPTRHLSTLLSLRKGLGHRSTRRKTTTAPVTSSASNPRRRPSSKASTPLGRRQPERHRTGRKATRGSRLCAPTRPRPRTATCAWSTTNTLRRSSKAQRRSTCRKSCESTSSTLTLAEARRQESEEGMPEIANYADERVRLLETVSASYRGAAQ